MSCIVVEQDTPGFTTRPMHRKLVWRSSNTAELYFDNVSVPRENLLGTRGQGFHQMLETLDSGRLSIAAMGLGGAQGAFEAALAYAQERQQFGKPISQFPAGTVPIQKMSMSCCGADDFQKAIGDTGRRQVLIAGIETHACVNQTAHDLLAAGYQVHVVHDATSSRRREEYDLGWAKLVQSGVVPATVESALLELVRTAEDPDFKAIQRLIK